MAKSKKEVSKNVLKSVDEIPERFKATIGEKKLYHTKSLINQAQEPTFEGYTYFGCGDFGFYYVKS
jgi:hypothetical protein